ncbi:alpha/beta fold hydrolase [Streptomyces sp. JJ38]|uniref:alpha/beta fold hydrolase n=1 Tax=Streptomyces sp. JJ38 TaxID=2738128 RepID=UPI001C578712|nr:alpha/beta hydrolase [Streptomyces sp. JJ38]MBW1598769.1 alpha/beta hydrolase [Streptomyces sp. JJ38]
MSVTVRTVTLPGGLTLPYAERGRRDGIPVVLVHGYVDSWRAFEPLLHRLPLSLHAFAPTQRGHGDAGKPPGGYLPRDFAADLSAFLDRLELEHAVLVGGSSGGVQARMAAARLPHRVTGLVLLGVPAALADKPGAEELWATVAELRDPIAPDFVERFASGLTAAPLDPAFLRTVVRENLKAPARVWRDTLRGLLDTDLRATLPHVRVPTLVVWGDRDTVLSRADQESIVDAVPDARLVVYEGAGHVVYWDSPERAARDVAEFAERVTASHAAREAGARSRPGGGPGRPAGP